MSNTIKPQVCSLDDTEQKLIITGQGTISCVLTKVQSFNIELSTDKAAIQGFRLSIDKNTVSFYQLGNNQVLKTIKRDGIGLDEDKKCQYWFSLDSKNCFLRYGKGEMRLLTVLAEYHYSKDDYPWVKNTTNVTISVPNSSSIWRDAVTIEPPVMVLPTDKITMDVVAHNWATTPAGLNPACQALYGNVSGENFTLDTPEFPEFTQAIERSIHDENGWCYQKLRCKSKEFGKDNILATYLRITMGVNQGNSPGVPFVLEIWPQKHFSPIHNHGNANAIIRVLHGEITVNLYSMLSNKHQTPFARKVFGKGDITWLAPGANQIHQLKNNNPNDETCITIQCYQYGENDQAHYEYFDYINSETNKIEQFDPTADMDFITFKALMHQEWLGVISEPIQCE